ncbi:LysR substrate-binding domain-containing protein [Arthrobacter sp. I2-34]|uniref:LysR substrate-binding domain-containing protein n=1 Tax=Arthrobacter hankyongi TaxID=2904801 RepID=A0ABS9L2U3_9MICC|nr:LysR substrate-binding domain-containing protein [Arthrobacter hankyongi]MCG2620964.1 LysR substrate-binding domain-containing protein [Arthrobacter hankyongi]
MFRYTLRQVEYFVAVADHGSLSAAADVCRVSQAGLSLAVTELEKAVGTQLLVRHKAKGATLTSAGRRFLTDARALLRQAGELQGTITERQGELAGPLAIGCYTTLSAFWIPAMTAGFAAPNPRLSLAITEGAPGELQEQLLDGRLDAVLTHTRHVVAGLQTQVIAGGRPYILLGANHPLAARRKIPLRELAGEDMVLLDIPSVRENQLPNLRASGLDPKIVWRSTSFEAVRGMVARGLGYTVLVQRPPLDLSYEGLPLACVEIDGEIGHSDICFAYPGGQRLTMRLQALMDFCVEEARRSGPPGRASSTS